MPAYSGPTRDEPLAVELYNTLYALRGHGRDGLVDAPALRGWLSAVGDRLPVPARSVDASRLDDVRALRAAVREALEACVEARPMDAAALDALNAFSARAS